MRAFLDLTKNGRLLVAIIAAATIFVVDVATPLGVACGVPHAAVVLLMLWIRIKGIALICAAICSGFILLGLGLSPGLDSVPAYLNRAIALVVVWTTAILVASRHDLDAALEDRERKFREVAETAPGVFWVIDARTREVVYVSPLFEALWGRTASELYRRPETWLDGVVDEDRSRVRAAFTRSLGNRTPFNQEYRVRHADGTIRHIHDRGAPVFDDRGRPLRFVGVAQDTTMSKRREEKLQTLANLLERQAWHDPLTELPNRRAFEKALRREVRRRRRSDSICTAVLLDCDDFKRINTSFGHAAGDGVLKELAHRMSTSLRPTDLLARIGGDEFLILLPNTPPSEAALLAERIRLAVCRTPVGPMKSGAEKVVVSISLGVAAVPAGTVSVEEVLAVTRHALESSKRDGKNRVTATAEPDLLESDATELVSRLMNEDCLRVVGQPIVELERDRVVGYETMIRGPTGPFQDPIDLFRFCAEQGILTLVDLKCARAALAWARARDLRGTQLHVTLFPSTLLATPVTRLLEMLDRRDDTFRLCIVFREQPFAHDPDALLSRVRALRRRGLLIAMCDVGSGHSSLEDLITLEPDIVKIDPSLVRGADADRALQSRLGRMLDVCRTLGSATVAMGVKTAAESAVLHRLGIRRAQGPLWEHHDAAAATTGVQGG